ncbi:hypothetical protein C7I85_27295 [Mesorhizobium soli]|uniref:CENP-V/GFA domain-containing protein n=2 Tax=Pseudaminobacter soli (ex Li et al. 2025) TaxID=1295366 RepID=A0A2P7RVV2_9HYPH|nr:hypothetical protein C7I85_27295 [Mesorhizobium soli]
MVAKARCLCGQVTLEVGAHPILSTVCHCSSCQDAALIFERLPGAAPILDESDGVAYVLFPKNCVQCTSGRENLREYRLKESSPTRRAVAACCNTFMFLDFTKGHWITICRDRLEDRRVIESAPVQNRQSPMFILRLMAAWARMGFRNPKIEFLQGRLENV